MNELFVVLNIKEYLRYDKGGEELLMSKEENGHTLVQLL